VRALALVRLATVFGVLDLPDQILADLDERTINLPVDRRRDEWWHARKHHL
jgi:hypothetical protein